MRPLRNYYTDNIVKRYFYSTGVALHNIIEPDFEKFATRKSTMCEIWEFTHARSKDRIHGNGPSVYILFRKTIRLHES